MTTKAPPEARPKGWHQNRYRKGKRVELKDWLEPDEHGRLVSQHPDCPHGTPEGYNLYSCRGVACTATVAERRADKRRRDRVARASTILLDRYVCEGPAGRVEEVALRVAGLVVTEWQGARGTSRLAKITHVLHAGEGRREMSRVELRNLAAYLVREVSAAAK